MKKNNKLIQAIQKLNNKLSCRSIGDDTIEVLHTEYGHICTLGVDDDIKVAEEIVRDELFEKSELANGSKD